MQNHPNRIRVLEAINHPVRVQAGNNHITKLLKPGANFRYDVWQLPDEKWQAEIVTMTQIQNVNWQSAIKHIHPTARKVLKLHHNDCIALNEGGQTRIMRVVKFSANDRICLAHINAAGDLKARDADKNDFFSYEVRSAAGLKSHKARQVRIDILGKLIDPIAAN